MEFREEYTARIDRVLGYIDPNLGGDLCLARPARVADFSPYHFHRVFKAIVGETVHAYTKRMRLKTAAVRLRHSPCPEVTRIALYLGFESPSDFARSFKAAYHTRPLAFARGRRGLLDGENPPDKGKSHHVCPRPEVTVRHIGDCPIAYIRCVGLSRTFRSPSIERAYARLLAWAKAHDLLGPQTRVVGVILDSPEVVPLSQCRFSACVTVPERAQPSPGVLIGRLGASGRYACMIFVRSDPRYPRLFFSAIEYLYATWLPDSGFVPDDRPFLEFYREEGAGSGTLLLDFCVPLVPL